MTTKAKTSLFAALGMALILSTPDVFAAKSDAKLYRLTGKVEIRTSKNAPWKKAKRGQTLKAGTEIRTNERSYARVRTVDKHQLRLSPKTTIRLDDTSKDKTLIKVFIGRMRSIVRRLKKRAKFQVRTPLAVASVRGTDFDTVVESKKKSQFEVAKGIVGVKDLAGIGSEVRLFKNQSTTVLRGKAPSPPEAINRRESRTLRDQEKVLDAKAVARLEARREISYQKFKEFLQTDVSTEQRLAEHQDGKTVIDAFGMRVRIEEYIVRPNSRQFSFVTINTRENTTNFSRYDAFSKNDLPANIRDINLLFSVSDPGGANPPSNNIVRQKWFVSNGGDLYREWAEGGDMVFFSEVNRWQVVFDHWFVEIKGKTADNFRLVSHWTPNPVYASGAQLVPTGTENILIDGVLDMPSGYINFESGTDTGSLIGDTRPIDASSFDTRLLNANIFGSANYQASEGYARTSRAEFDGTDFSTIPTVQGKLNAILTAKEVSAVHSYTGPSGGEITNLRVDEYTVTDEGTRLSRLDRANSGVSFDSINFESVTTSSDFSSKIDLILAPRIFRDAGLISAQ